MLTLSLSEFPEALCVRGGNAPAGGFPWVSLVSELLFKRGKSSEFLFFAVCHDQTLEMTELLYGTG